MTSHPRASLQPAGEPSTAQRPVEETLGLGCFRCLIATIIFLCLGLAALIALKAAIPDFADSFIAIATPSPTPALTITTPRHSYLVDNHGDVHIHFSVHNPTTHTFPVTQIYLQPWEPSLSGLQCQMMSPPVPNESPYAGKDTSTHYYYWNPPNFTLPPGTTTLQIDCHVHKFIYTRADIGVFLHNAPRPLKITITLNGTP